MAIVKFLRKIYTLLMSLYFITGSKGKFKEIQSILSKIRQLEIDLPEIQEIDARKIVEAKLQSAFEHHSGEFIVEDTSLYLNCLNGLPGPLIKWFIKSLKNEGIVKITEKFANNFALAKTIIGYSDRKKNINFFEGEVKGRIVAARGSHGFGWNPIFQPNGETRTFGEMSLEEKQKYSMRRIAAEKLKIFLNKNKI